MIEEKIYMPKKNKRKTKEIAISIIIVVIITIIALFIVSSVKKNNYHKTYEYKLGQLGYSKEEINELLKLDDDFIDHVLEIDYDENILKVIKEKYYLEKNLDSYLAYAKENSNKSLTDVVALINTHANNKWYTNTIKTDEDKDLQIIINKFYYTDGNYEPSDLVTIKNWYAYGDGQLLRQKAYDNFISMYNEAKKSDITLIINSAYRSYADQEEVYNDYVTWYGETDANKIAAKPGHSEHQTGLAIDIVTPGYNSKTFEESTAFTWLQNNAYKYGYILRYPKDKEYLTGYDYESWHYRYVGEEIAKYIHDNNITYDEYYAYFLEDK